MERMGLNEIMRMNGGTGETSYAANSFIQKTGIEKVRPLVEECIKALCSSPKHEELDQLTVADLGCSSGPNALAVLQSIIDMAVSTCRGSGRRVPEFEAFMNDLPQNDFNTIFKSLPEFYNKLELEKGAEISCFISGTPGSFYGRLFPSNSIHFTHSSYSLHWLSQVPGGLVGEDGEGLNKGCIYARKESPARVLQAYRQQFAKDFTLFLRCRSEEILRGGRMVLTFAATQDDEIAVGMECASQALNTLANQGLIDKAKLDAFNLPFYRPTMEQVRQVIEGEGSFAIQELDTFGMAWDDVLLKADMENNTHHQDAHISRFSRLFARGMRVVLEPLLATEFGEEIMDHVFALFEDMAKTRLIHAGSLSKFAFLNVVVSLIKKD